MSSVHIYPYVYRLTHKETGHFYIGVRYANKVPAQEDLGIRYFTSSQYVKTLGFENFNYHVVAEFFEKKSALEFEELLIREDWRNPLQLNKCLGGSKFISPTGRSPSQEERCAVSRAHTGKIVSDKTRSIISSIHKGKTVSLETRMKISESRSNYRASDETRSKQSSSMKGKVNSTTHNENISAARKGLKFTDEHRMALSNAAKARHAKKRQSLTDS